MFSSPSNEVEIECSHDRRKHEDDDNLSFLNELLFDVEGAQESHWAQIKNKDEIREFDNIIEHSIQNDWNHVLIRESKQRENNDEDIDNNNLYFDNDDSTCEKQNEMHYFFNISSIVIDLIIKYDFWNFHSLILVLTNDVHLNVLFFTRKQKILFFILFFHFVIPFFRQYTIHKFASKI